MNKPLLIVQNHSREEAGTIALLAREHAIPTITVDLSSGDSFPDPSHYKAVIVLGGPNSANDDTPNMRQEIAQVQVCLEKGIPYLGVCLGLQVLVRAAGGVVVQNPVREIGVRDPKGNFFTITLTERGKKDRWCTGLPSKFPVFQLHGETVMVTKGMTLLGTGEFCRNQLVKVGKRAYGIQAHLELTPTLYEKWKVSEPDLASIDDKQLDADYSQIESQYANASSVLFSNFFTIAGLIPS